MSWEFGYDFTCDWDLLAFMLDHIYVDIYTRIEENQKNLDISIFLRSRYILVS